jgi:hypothetical protein
MNNDLTILDLTILDLTILDGLTITAITSSYAYGCGGIEDSDTVDGASTFIWSRELGHTELEQIEQEWSVLWDARYSDPNAALRREIAASVGVTLPEAPAQAPPWDKKWKGTRAQWLQASETASTIKTAYDRSITELLATARIALLRSYGGTLVDVWIPSHLQLVHDYGCRCAHSNETTGAGVATVHVRADKLFVAPTYANIDDALAQVRRAGQEAATAAIKHNAATIATVPLEDFTDVKVHPSHDDTLSYSEWFADLQARRSSVLTQLDQALNSGDWKSIRNLGGRWARGIQDPTPARFNAERSEMYKLRVAELSAQAVQAIMTLVATRPR